MTDPKATAMVLTEEIRDPVIAAAVIALMQERDALKADLTTSRQETEQARALVDEGCELSCVNGREMMGDDHRLELVMELIREVIHDAEKAAERRMLEKVLAAAEKLENTVAIEKVQIMTAPRIAASEGG